MKSVDTARLSEAPSSTSSGNGPWEKHLFQTWSENVTVVNLVCLSWQLLTSSIDITNARWCVVRELLPDVIGDDRCLEAVNCSDERRSYSFRRLLVPSMIKRLLNRMCRTLVQPRGVEIGRLSHQTVHLPRSHAYGGSITRSGGRHSGIIYVD